MSVVTVSFFSDLDVSSRTRRVSFPRAPRPTLHLEIRQAMQSREFYACYTTSDGGTVALDQPGRYRSHLIAFLPAIRCKQAPGLMAGGHISYSLLQCN